MKKLNTYHSDVRNGKFDSIIIGSEIGGLRAAALLRIKGKRVLVLEKQVAGLKENIDQQELLTPLTFRDLANYTKGEINGIDHSQDCFRKRWLRLQSSTKNLFFVGQDITTEGVSSALFTGLLTASTVLGQNLSSLLKD